MLTIFILVIRSKRIGSPIILNDELKNNPEYIGEDDLKYLISKEGVALTDLRPFGKGSFDGVELDVKSNNGKFITHDTRIKIVGIKDKTLSVKSI
jgi:membrane-bound ClpP family serine protease